MHCRFARGDVFAEIPPLGAATTGQSARDAILAAILAKAQPVRVNMSKQPPKRSCRKRRRGDEDLKKLQRDVQDLEDRLQAARTKKNKCPFACASTKATELGDEHKRRLQSVLQACHPAADSPNKGFPFVPHCSAQLEYEPSVDAPLFQKMEQSLQSQYDELDVVFRDAGLNHDKTQLDDAQVVAGGQHGTFVRFSSAKVAPFALDTISGAMWTTAKKNSVLNMTDTIEADGADTITYLKRKCVLQHDGGQGVDILLRGACRRVVEPHRIVLVWEGMGDWPRDYARRHPSSVPIRERGYCIVQNFSSSKSKAPLSLFQTIVCMTPGLSAGIAMDQPDHLKMLAEVVVPSYRKILEAREQILENAILDEMIHSRMQGSPRL